MQQQFYIVSELNGKVMDVQGNGPYPNGTPIIMWHKNGGANQRWIKGPGGIIQSVQCGKALDLKGGLGKGNYLHVWDPNGQQSQKFTYQQNGTFSIGGLLVADIKGDNKSDGAQVIAWDYNGKPNQRWRLENA